MSCDLKALPATDKQNYNLPEGKRFRPKEMFGGHSEALVTNQRFSLITAWCTASFMEAKE